MSDYKKKEEFGICPCCGTGHIVKTDTDYVCTNRLYSHNGVKSCNLSIPFYIHGVAVTDNMVRQLVNDGKTEPMVMTDSKVKPFKGRFIAVPGKGLEVEFNRDYLNAYCPVCGGRIVKTKSRYACENMLSKHPTCDFYLPNYYCGRIITPKEAEDFCNGQGDILDDLYDRKKKRHYSAYINRHTDGSLTWDSVVGSCPICGGSVLVSGSAFNCSNNAKSKTCTFHVWRDYEHHRLTLTEIRDLLKDGKTKPFVAYDEKGHKSNCYLMLGQNGEVITKNI